MINIKRFKGFFDGNQVVDPFGKELTEIVLDISRRKQLNAQESQEKSYKEEGS